MDNQKVLLIFLGLFFLGCAKNSMQDNINEKNDTVLLEKRESWGPCPSIEYKCYQSTKLYYSGKLILEGSNDTEKQLDKNSFDRIINQIKASQIFDKDCYAQEVLDYGATYKLNLDGRKKTIGFPGCEDELRKIEELVR